MRIARVATVEVVWSDANYTANSYTFVYILTVYIVEVVIVIAVDLGTNKREHDRCASVNDAHWSALVGVVVWKGLKYMYSMQSDTGKVQVHVHWKHTMYNETPTPGHSSVFHLEEQHSSQPKGLFLPILHTETPLRIDLFLVKKKTNLMNADVLYMDMILFAW